MPGKKVSGADNQQERLKTAGWIMGFVDGEGCFTVSIFKNSKAQRKLGWQVFPEFVVSQGEKSLSTLKFFQDYFKCGFVIKNSRHDNHRDDMYKYCVRSQKDLREAIIPFFLENKLKSAKQKDFEIFVSILQLMAEGKHLNQTGLKQIAKLALTMNRKVRPKFSEILRY